jgi:carbamoyltransferase
VAAVLGISAHYHDAAAALVVDGRIVAAMQEERFSRLKNDPALPRRAAHACLALGKLAAAELDAVVFYENPYAKLERVVVSLMREYPRSFRQFSPALGGQLGSKLWVLDQIADMLGVERRVVRFVEHHESHAACAFLCSPYPDAAVLTVDGVGEAATTALWRGEGAALRCLGAIDFPHSLGLLYAAFTAYLGFEVNEGEYKVMGLAAHGRPRFRDELARVLRLEPDGSFTLEPRFFAHGTDRDVGFSPALEKLLGPRRPPGRPFDLEANAREANSDDRRCADIAASLQTATEEALLGLARAARERTGATALCLAGGVALNALANGRLAREAGFERVFVPPAAGDAGGALGAALLGARDLGDPRPAPLASAALGEPFDTGAAVDLARALGLTPLSVPDPDAAAAARIAAGKVVALCRGRFEFGPRALGQRSLLADATRAESRERLNRVIKQREPFRPFAPAISAAAAPAFFAGAPNDMTPFMTTVCRTEPARAAALPAVVHVDGTARVQTVTAPSAPELAPILAAVERETGIPVVLNTSLNGAGEPIVAGPVEALAFFLQHPVDALVVGDTLIERSAT